MPSALSHPVDTSEFPAYFSLLPVRVHHESKAIDEAALEAIDICAPEGSKVRKSALRRLCNPLGGPYILCFPESDTEKLKLFAQCFELFWTHDDITEDLPHNVAQREHALLLQALDPSQDWNNDIGETVGNKKQYLRTLRDAMFALDPVLTPALFESVRQFLEAWDTRERQEFGTMEEYWPYRLVDGGADHCFAFLRWAMNISLTDEDLQVVSAFEASHAKIMTLINDNFSWNMEKFTKTGVVFNSVPILMRQYGLQEDLARTLVKGLIIDEQQKAAALKRKLEEVGVSAMVQRYIEGLELFAAGNMYWSASCARYNNPQQ